MPAHSNVSLFTCQRTSFAPLARTGTNNGLYICIDSEANVFSDANRTALDFNDAILFKVLSAETQRVSIAIPRRGDYLCRVELLDAKGNQVPKSKIGSQMGSRWGQSGTYGEAKPDRATAAPGAYEPSGSRRLYKPSELFVTDKPGDYRLQLEFQVFHQVTSKTNSLMKLMHFGPVQIHVVK